LTPRWAGAAQWRTLAVGLESSADFLQLWHAWRTDPQRPRMLHFVAICAGDFKNTNTVTELTPLAELLDAQMWGLLPGFHRLVFEGGQVLLTLCVGDAQAMLKQQRFQADSVLLNVLADTPLAILNTVKAIARLCRHGTALSTTRTNAPLQSALKQCGFELSTSDSLQATYQPAWLPAKDSAVFKAGRCMVVGAGLAGAAVASSLARRGWAVTVLDAQGQPASGASSLPAGLLVPHTSPDDSLLSQLSRCGVRVTLQQCRALLRHGLDWGHTGVLQRGFDGGTFKLPLAWGQQPSQAASDWCYPASAKTLAAAGLAEDRHALWHPAAGWVKPSALVKAWLAAPGTTWQGNAPVATLEHAGHAWRALDAAGQLLAEGDMIVLCAGHASQLLAETAGGSPPDLQAIRGQVTFGLQSDPTVLPPFPVNGDGGLISNITTPDGPLWLMGASYERNIGLPELKPQDHAENFARLQRLLPQVASALADQFTDDAAQGWAGIRCATPNRLPWVGPLGGAGDGGSDVVSDIWLCTGMGSRGLSFAALCGELLAARLHNEPLPIAQKLADALHRLPSTNAMV
jgi:tRNA 5-methylaminomethyl-2-thiouridine biosynthesis bifunctional protein